MSATSGRENSCGGRSPARSMSRTFVPGQRHAILLAVRARLRRRHPLAAVAPERVLEVQRRDPELARLELLEDLLRVVGAVVVADAGVVATDDEVRAAVVLAADRVPDGLLAGPRTASRPGSTRPSRGPSGSSPRTAPRSSASARPAGRRRPSSRRPAGARAARRRSRARTSGCTRARGGSGSASGTRRPSSSRARRTPRASAAGVSRYCRKSSCGGSAITSSSPATHRSPASWSACDAGVLEVLGPEDRRRLLRRSRLIDLADAAARRAARRPRRR